MFYIVKDTFIYVLDNSNDQNMLFEHGKINEYWTKKKKIEKWGSGYTIVTCENSTFRPPFFNFFYIFLDDCSIIPD